MAWDLMISLSRMLWVDAQCWKGRLLQGGQPADPPTASHASCLTSPPIVAPYLPPSFFTAFTSWASSASWSWAASTIRAHGAFSPQVRRRRVW